MNYQNLLITTQDAISTITINRPKKLNALNSATIQELHHAFEHCNTDPQTRVILLIGSGDKAFVAGADIKEFADFSEEKGRELAQKGQELLFDFVANLETPVIALINGFALGGGLELAMAAHFRIASDTAKMGLPEVSLGVIPGYGGTQRLPQLIGKGRAMEMIMTGGMIDASQAMEYGLVNHVVTLDELVDCAKGIASKIIKNSPNAIGQAIGAINAGFEDGIDGFQKEINAFGHCFGTPDFIEGTTAFLEKRKANF